ncbi:MULTISPECIES: DUF397 domain-containing protein [unclassified Streptomyces]|uniref:DUF397 domain-containing protein n=1 Tax=unclassified Streptomyces TaxID=2593676 RepID=UPI00315D6921
MTPFRKSSYSSGGQGSERLEVAHTADGGRAVRDSKNPAGGLQFFEPEDWAAFIDGVKDGAFGG